MGKSLANMTLQRQKNDRKNLIDKYRKKCKSQPKIDLSKLKGKDSFVRCGIPIKVIDSMGNVSYKTIKLPECYTSDSAVIYKK